MVVDTVTRTLTSRVFVIELYKRRNDIVDGSLTESWKKEMALKSSQFPPNFLFPHILFSEVHTMINLCYLKAKYEFTLTLELSLISLWLCNKRAARNSQDL